MARERISMSDGELREFLDQQSWMLLVTLDAGGAPNAALVPVRREGDRVLFEVEADAEAARNLERDPRACVSNDAYPTYYEIRGATIHGEAAAVSEAAGLGGPGRHLYALGLDDVVSFDFAKIENRI
jgi:predicted pyridoxine 5'-phosphate oxidase superfamily flavin-nucleotide-binding protein